MLNEHLDNNLSEISAEMLLNYLYPDLADRWIVQAEGTFYRNYNRDVLTYDEENAEIQVARDGFQKLLPQGMLFTTRNKNHEDLRNSINEQNAKMKVTVGAELNPFIKSMVEKPLQDGVEKIADALAQVKYV